MPTSSPITLETERLTQHFAGADAELRPLSTAHLDRTRRLVRALLFDELADYARARRFPKNRDFPDRDMPYFVDADGTRCAVAHLMEASGASGLARRIARRRNNALVPELANEPGVAGWLAAAGLTVAEAARIQPRYFRPPPTLFCPSTCICERSGIMRPAEAVLEARATGITESRVQTTVVTVTGIFGTAPGIAIGQQLTVQDERWQGRPGHTGLEWGTMVLVPYPARSADGLYAAVPLAGSMPDTCDSDVARANPLTTEQTITAFVDDHCEAYLEGIDPSWHECELRDWGRGPPGCRSCSTSGGGDASSAAFALLASLVTLRASRAMRKRPALPR